MTRIFSKPIKRAALERSGGRCEAEGEWYGLPDGTRCNADLGYGVEFDHIILWADSRDSSLSNCRAVCARCHKHKTTSRDTPRAAETARIADKHRGIRTSRNPLPGSRKSRWKKLMNGKVVER